jgi:hypothetical protein
MTTSHQNIMHNFFQMKLEVVEMKLEVVDFFLRFLATQCIDFAQLAQGCQRCPL